ncbi:hypothetical protein [Turicimonas muris]|uniref:hypothetical protein n=1 Tax=Turicimonas muris TaxID=1796652 RepID=UPI0012ED33F5|nr:hypothetical protein [Turicimonas muris]QQQ96485.1 hypothetical protein I5Q81_11165 [Turicimonas muris]
MSDVLKLMILEASRRCKKPSQIQKFVFKNYGYNVSFPWLDKSCGFSGISSLLAIVCR